MKTKEMLDVINEYKKQNNIENITYEELLDILPGSELEQKDYWPSWSSIYFSPMIISDYDMYMLRKGVNLIEGDYIDVDLDEIRADFHFVDVVDTIEPQDVDFNPWLCQCYETFEESLQEAATMDRFYFMDNEAVDYIRSGICERIDNINEYLSTKKIDNDFAYMKADDLDSISQGEWECELQDELDAYRVAMRTETVDIYVKDAGEAIRWYRSEFDDTTLHLRVHCDAGDGKFLIVTTHAEYFYFYGVYLEFEYEEDGYMKELGTCTDPDDVSKIILYYISTGDCFGHL